MKLRLTIALLLIGSTSIFAQNDDPVIMTINNQPIKRSEFEYSYNKNNAEGVIDKKSVKEYVDLFVNYKLKVCAAKEAKMDTMSSFKQEFSTYRDQQIRPSFVSDADVEQRAFALYRKTQQQIDSMGGLVKPAHILIGLQQTADKKQEQIAKNRIDSIYRVLQKGGDFATLAKQFSDDKGSAVNGGELPWIAKGQTLKEFDETVFAMKKGEMSKPFLSPAGYHIILLKEKQNFFPYDSMRTNIIKYIEQAGIRNQIATQKIDSIAKSKGESIHPSDVLAQRMKELEEKDPNLKYLIQEYHDGLLLYNIMNEKVWDKASKDEKGLEKYFKKNKKKYKWEQPRFKGVAYYTKDKKDIKAVKSVLKRVDFKDWTETLRKTFNNDSVLRIKAEKGIFKQGDNQLVDAKIFKTGTEIPAKKDYPYYDTYGKKLKAPKDYADVRGQVLTDYQDALEKEWVEYLRKKYPVYVDKNVLATVNKH